MNKKLVIAALAVTLTSCFTYNSIYKYTGVYKVGLQNVESPKNIKEQFGEKKVTSFQEQGVTKYTYEDNLIKIIWLPLNSQFSFTLTNKSDNTIKIIWDDAVYVDENGINRKVIHAGIKYIEKNNNQLPTTIVKGARIDDLVLPTNKINYMSGDFGGWYISPLFDDKARTTEELITITSSYVGKYVKILLPIKIEDVTNEYLFIFKIEDFEAIKK